MSAGYGMMEGAYFVGRVELLNWLNDLLKLDYTKVEQTASAAAFCQIIDSIHPGSVNLTQVNFNANTEYEYVKNFKVLQKAFDKLQIDKSIDVAKLVKAKYQDNLEFLQWIKRYFDLNYGGAEYDAIERRKGSYAADKKTLASGGGSAFKPAVAKPAAPKVSAPAKVATKPAATTKTAVAPVKAVAKPSATKTATPKSSGSSDAVNEITTQLNEAKLAMEGAEKERDFYYGKLRDIEILCQNNDQENELVKSILAVMYSTQNNEEFASEESTAQEAEDDETF